MAAMRILALLLLLATPALAFDLSGTAVVTDGDTFDIGEVKIRLYGVDTPPSDPSSPERGPATKRLERMGYTRAQILAEGRRAKRALDDLLTGTIIACIPKGKSWNRIVAICYLPDGRDVARVMVDLGYASDWPTYSKGYYAR